MDKCIKHGVHYLDISAELDSYRVAESLDKEAQVANVMLLPGCGGSVAILGCLTKHVLDRNSTSKPTGVDAAVHIVGTRSRGSARSAAASTTGKCFQRRDGELEVVAWKAGEEPTKFDFHAGKGDVPCLQVTLPDLITLQRSARVANIRTFVHRSGGAVPVSDDFEELPDGPSAAERAASPYQAVAAVIFEDGTVKRAVLHSVNRYTFISQASVLAASRVVSGAFKAGCQTPAELFGSGFLTTVAGCAVIGE
jgi:short subunit dehydrogenase-like uncharacterized protein